MKPDTSSVVSFSVRLIADEEHRDELLQTLRSAVGPTRGTAGCLRCSLLEDVQQPDELLFEMEWKSEAAFAQYVQSALFRRVLQGMDLAAELPVVEIKTVSGVGGMAQLRELVEAGRNNSPDNTDREERAS